MFNFLIDTLSVPLLVVTFYGTLTILVFFKHCSPFEICSLFWLSFFFFFFFFFLFFFYFFFMLQSELSGVNLLPLQT